MQSFTNAQKDNILHEKHEYVNYICGCEQFCVFINLYNIA